MANRATKREFRYGCTIDHDEGFKILEGVKDPDVLVATKAALEFRNYMEKHYMAWRRWIPAFYTHQDYTYFKKLFIKLLTDHRNAVRDENQDHIEIEEQVLREQALEDAEQILSHALPDVPGMVGLLKSLYSPSQLREIFNGLGLLSEERAC